MFYYWLTAVLCATLYLLHKVGNPALLFMANGDDSDMKIFGAPSGEPQKEPESGADEAARIFLKHKEQGNIERAKLLGAQYGEWLVHESEPMVEYGLCSDEREACYQRYLLCAYVISMSVRDKSPDAIVSNAIMTAFYDYLRDNSPRLYEDITDSAAFSLYILRARTQRFVDDAMGRVFSVLCAHDDEPEYVEIGKRIYLKCNAYCAKLFDKAGFVAINA